MALILHDNNQSNQGQKSAPTQSNTGANYVDYEPKKNSGFSLGQAALEIPSALAGSTLGLLNLPNQVANIATQFVAGKRPTPEGQIPKEGLGQSAVDWVNTNIPPQGITQGISKYTPLQVPGSTEEARENFKEFGKDILGIESGDVQPGSWGETARNFLGRVTSFLNPIAGISTGAKTAGEAVKQAAKLATVTEVGSYAGRKTGRFLGNLINEADRGELSGDILGMILGGKALEKSQELGGKLKAVGKTEKFIDEMSDSSFRQRKELTKGQKLDSDYLKKSIDSSLKSLDKLPHSDTASARENLAAMNRTIIRNRALKQKGKGGKVLATGEEAVEQFAESQKPVLVDQYGKPLKAPSKTELTPGSVQVDDVIDQIEKINTKIYDPKTPKTERQALELAKDGLNKGLESYWAKNPEASKAYQLSNELYSAKKYVDGIGNFIHKTNLGKIVNNDLLKSLLYGVPGSLFIAFTGGKLLPALGAAAGAGGAIYGAYKYSRFQKLLEKSPTAAKVFEQAKDALKKESVTDFRKYIFALNKEMNNLQKNEDL